MPPVPVRSACASAELGAAPTSRDRNVRVDRRISGDRHPPLVRALLDLLLPPTCPGCGTEGEVLCGGCAAALWRRVQEPAGWPIGLDAAVPVGIVQLEWCASFAGPVRAALHELKYGGERRLAKPLGDALAARWRVAGRGGDLVTWVPVHPRRKRERGFDQAEELAHQMGSILGLASAPTVSRVAATTAQHGLGQQERLANLAGAFAVGPSGHAAVDGRWPILVDDVVTTGATLAACAAALRAAGAIGVSAIAVAHER
jgi:ComF family protein